MASNTQDTPLTQVVSPPLRLLWTRNPGSPVVLGDRYRVNNTMLGSGLFATVYVATELQLNESCAIKVHLPARSNLEWAHVPEAVQGCHAYTAVPLPDEPTLGKHLMPSRGEHLQN